MRRAGFDEVDDSHDVYVDALLPGSGAAVHAHWGGEWLFNQPLKMVSWASRQYILPRELAVHSICNCRVQPSEFFHGGLYPLAKRCLGADVQRHAHRCGFVRQRQSLEKIVKFRVSDVTC